MNAKAQATEQRILSAAQPLAELMGLDLVEVVFVDARRRPTVRVFVDVLAVDRDGGVTLDECAEFSRRLGESLDALEITSGSYNLEVSSPGVERPFSSLKAYQRSLNKPVEVVLQEPIEKISHLRGTLVDVAEDRIVVRTDEGRSMEVPMSRIKRANRVVTF